MPSKEKSVQGKFNCRVCGKPGTEIVSYFHGQDKVHRVVHGVRNTCDCWKLFNVRR
jgi:hypothetical protein